MPPESAARHAHKPLNQNGQLIFVERGGLEVQLHFSFQQRRFTT